VTADPYRRYGDDPEAYAREIERIHLYSKQMEVVRAVQEHDRVACKAANAVGKTVVGAFVARWWLSAGPGSIVIATAATEGQLRRVLMREIRSGVKRAGDFFAGAVVTESEIRLADDWYLAAFSTDTPEALQGHHGERVLVLVDEASGLDEAIYEAAEGLLAGGDTKLLLLGNPLRTSGSFYDAFTSRRDEFHRLSISAFDTPAWTGEKVPRALRRKLVSRKWAERLEKRGPESNEYRVRVLAEFPDRADDSVVALADLQQAQEQTVETGLPLVIGVDVARFGGDKTVVAVREGHRIRVAKVTSGRDLMWTTGSVLDLARSLHERTGRKPRIVVDDVGLGGGVTDRLREIGEFQVVAFNGGGKASSRDAVNRRSELWLRAGEVMPLLDLDGGDEELAADLLAPTFSFASDGARLVEPKANTRKRLRRSPDRADAVLLTLAVEPPVAPGRTRKRRGVSWAKGAIDEYRFAGHPRAAARASAASVNAPRGGRVERIPIPGEVPLGDRLVQLGVPISDPVADRYGAGLLGRLVGHGGASHPFLAEGDETPRGSWVAKAEPIAPLMQDHGGFTWDGPEGSR
jgi:phage terminase large subunit